MKKLKLNNFCIITSFAVVINISAYAQLKPSIKNLQGLWKTKFENGNITTIKIIIDNKIIDIDYVKFNYKATVFGEPFGYFGFVGLNDNPKKISELKNEGDFIKFYYDLNHDYNANGYLLGPDISCPISLNEDLENDPEPKVMYLYFRGTPDAYSKIDTIPSEILLLLRKNKADWKKYADFIGMKQRAIKSEKVFIYSTPESITKMYLMKNDTVEFLEEKGEWVKFRFYGKKLIKGWLKKENIKF